MKDKRMMNRIPALFCLTLLLAPAGAAPLPGNVLEARAETAAEAQAAVREISEVQAVEEAEEAVEVQQASDAKSESRGLVIEVVEEIPADSLVELEDSEVPLAGSIGQSGNRMAPIMPLLACLSAAALAFAGYELIGNRHRNALLRMRREGYREEARRLRAKS